MKRWTVIILLLTIVACKQKPRDSTENYFSALSFLQAQIKKIDTTRYTFTKIEVQDSISDTSVIQQQDFRKYANDFLTLPDISSENNRDHYDESNTYDEDLNNVLLTYTPKNEKEEIRRETIMLEPNESGESKVKTILINRIMVGKDSIVEKEMAWHVDKRFQIVTKITKGNQPENIKTRVVQWE